MTPDRKFGRPRRLLLAAGALLVAALSGACLIYPPAYVYRVLVWQNSDVFDWQKFPARPLRAAAEPYRFVSEPAPRVEALFAELAHVSNWNEFLQENETQAFLVIQNERILFERYFNGSSEDSIVTSFSAAKSIDSLLIGMAIDEGLIESAQTPITRYLPELRGQDPRLEQVTIEHLLRMSSGFEYQEFRALLFNSDDALSSYHPNQRAVSLEHTRLELLPGSRFRYNKYHPQLLGMILERTTGMSVTEYTQTRLWDRLGMEYARSWSLDSVESGFEKMETGVNARARDFAKIGALVLAGGRWRGKQIVSPNWLRISTGPHLPADADRYYPDFFRTLPGHAYYQYMWWGFVRKDGSYDIAAHGNKGQFIYVSPKSKLIIVRNGIDYGIPVEEWFRLFFEFSQQFQESDRP